MIWTEEALSALKRAPFFVRKRIQKRVEEDAVLRDVEVIDLDFVTAAKKRFLSNMENEVTGHALDVCFGKDGCPHKAADTQNLVNRLEELLEKEDLLGFLKNVVKGKLKFHHTFRITAAECPNGCSQPQIKDMGIIGAKRPGITETPCSFCCECVHVCKEKAVIVHEDKGPMINPELCVDCGDCINVCPTGTLKAAIEGFRVLLGGKLGRHPRLGLEMDGIFSENEVVDIVGEVITFYKNNAKNGERFGALVTDDVFTAFNERFCK